LTWFATGGQGQCGQGSSDKHKSHSFDPFDGVEKE